MKLYSIETGNFMLDGGAIFGVVPKVLWEKHYPANEKNLINLAMRSMLIDTGDRKILLDCGMGNKQDAKFFGYYFPNGNATLVSSLEQINISPDDITDVVLSHLHFDHCGGAVMFDDTRKLIPTFKNATHYISKQQWENALDPNQREKSSYLKENIMPLDNDTLVLIDNDTSITDYLELRLFHGHTAGQIIPIITAGDRTIVYIADLIPLACQIPVSWITAYDIEPLKALQEKEDFLAEACEKKYTLFFEHDLYNECCTLHLTPKGVRSKECFPLHTIIPR